MCGFRLMTLPKRCLDDIHTLLPIIYSQKQVTFVLLVQTFVSLRQRKTSSKGTNFMHHDSLNSRRTFISNVGTTITNNRLRHWQSKQKNMDKKMQKAQNKDAKSLQILATKEKTAEIMPLKRSFAEKKRISVDTPGQNLLCFKVP